MWGLLPFFVDVVYLTALKGGVLDPTANKDQQVKIKLYQGEKE
jgi:hypothetical protein